ncbi:hypothetical protein PoB_005923600 [Plakobranchus ocellatus]|uniref:Uncharacterized protein n=1 Tax=Plakobranchus ocellatus TaxID=259542 RepID=A0AAV4CLU9_9GAST|nr:hypothetical protein PoB_005923600 [Plakobranchus ocellatus]
MYWTGQDGHSALTVWAESFLSGCVLESPVPPRCPQPPVDRSEVNHGPRDHYKTLGLNDSLHNPAFTVLVNRILTFMARSCLDKWNRSNCRLIGSLVSVLAGVSYLTNAMKYEPDHMALMSQGSDIRGQPSLSVDLTGVDKLDTRPACIITCVSTTVSRSESWRDRT